MRRRTPLVVMAAAMAFCAVACSGPQDTMSVTRARIPVPASPIEASVYLVITNDSDSADRLVGIESKAEQTQIHQTTIAADGTASMSPVLGVDVGSRETVRFVPGGLHVMLFDPPDLSVGDSFDLLLTFENGGKVMARARVVADVADVVEQ